MFLLSIMLGYYTWDVYKTFGQTHSVTGGESYITMVGTLGGLFGALRFVWSAALDKYSIKQVYGTLLSLQVILAFTMHWAKLSKPTYAAWFWLIVNLEGAHFVLAPNILRIIYGDQATQLMGVFFTYTGLASIILIVILLTPFATMYIWSFLLCCLFSIISLFLLIFVFKSKRFRYI